ncbi:MAG: helix-turn-helix domain-containing protein [Bacteroidetes bacterium]|nr:MAG: helix-turn-helix domain-containing protein [Bacteroidota bacterium]
MLKKHSNPAVGSDFFMANAKDFKQALKLSPDHLKFIWNRNTHPAELLVDGSPLTLFPNQVLCCTYLQHITCELKEDADLILLSFNKAFYCIHTHDAEVSCNGLLFFGSDYTPVIQVDEHEQQSLNTLVKVLEEEFDTIDGNQEEMLRILLKRFIIKSTRIARKQMLKGDLPEERIDIIRQFNVLVEEHFKSLKHVSDYAAIMHRSPKTLTNVFSQHASKSPLQVIHDRIILEARRMLIFTDKSAKEIAWKLGYEDPSQFSRFFKKNTQMSIQDFKEKYKKISFGQF